MGVFQCPLFYKGSGHFLFLTFYDSSIFYPNWEFSILINPWNQLINKIKFQEEKLKIINKNDKSGHDLARWHGKHAQWVLYDL